MTKKSTAKASSASPKAAKAAPKAAAKGVGSKLDAAHEGGKFNQLVNHHYLTEAQFGVVAETLQRNLATTICLYLKFKKFHWDIRGRHFRDLHLAYDDFIDEVFPAIDEIAERLVALGGSPKDAPSDLEKYSAITVPTSTVRDAREQVSELVDDLSTIGRGYRDDSQACDEAGDPATADMYNGYAATIDKIRWMLQAQMDDTRFD